MKLYELHATHSAFGSVNHGDTIAGSHGWIRSIAINRADAASGHHRDFREYSHHLLGLGIVDVSTEAGDVGSASADGHTQMVLRDNLHCQSILHNLNIRILLGRFNQFLLNLQACHILVVQHTKL